MTDITVNGTVHHLDGDPETPLLWYLRDQLGLLARGPIAAPHYADAAQCT